MARHSNRNHRDFHHPSLSYETPTLLRRFRTGLTLLVSFLVAGGLWTGLWFAATSYVKGQVAQWQVAQGAAGGRATVEAMEVSGFPTRVVLMLAKPVYHSGPDGLGLVAGRPVGWRAETLTLSARPWWPWRIHAEAPGPQTVEWGALTMSGQAEQLSADLSLGEPWPERLTVAIQGLNLQGDAALVAEALTLDFHHDASVALTVAGSNLTLPLGGGWGLGDTVQSLDAELRVIGPVAPGPLAERLPAWRDGGGTLEVDQLKLRVGPLALATSGTVALDDALQPIAAFTAKFEGLFQVLEIFRKQGLVRDSDAVVATMALSAFSKRGENGAAPSINLAVSVQDGKLSLGPIPILDMPTFTWGIAPPEPVSDEEPVRDYKDVPPIY